MGGALQVDGAPVKVGVFSRVISFERMAASVPAAADPTPAVAAPGAAMAFT